MVLFWWVYGYLYLRIVLLFISLFGDVFKILDLCSYMLVWIGIRLVDVVKVFIVIFLLLIFYVMVWILFRL